ncbi:MAG: hypothetical protein C7B46_18570 [Sulfobacillus benefaciens]|uniref:Photosynthesis system II assembly factor Ycf48/Hcf136-like domain-containing protein n=1 Tax=Sulfobacillus benefaciens TaxID=453960 RepID=A0A2T2X4Y4_9FIRM|nr:MAG: hypothetical protein C7B46_18570 [Sulfobacillus benefaciens]
MDTDEGFNPEEKKLWQAFHNLPIPPDPPLTFDVTPWAKKVRRPHLVKTFIVLAVLIIGGGGWLVLRTLSPHHHLSASYLAQASLTQIHMNTVTTGWAIGNNFTSIYHTTSGGQYWSKVYTLASAGQIPYAIAFPSAHNAEVIMFNTEGNTVSIGQTQDQGKQWQTTTLPLHPTGLSGGSLVVASGRQYLGIGVTFGQSRTVDLFDHRNGSRSWNLVQYAPDLYNLASLSLGPQGSLWMIAQPVAGKPFAVFQSHNGGKNWIAVHLPPLPVKTSALMPLEPKFFGNSGILPVMVNVPNIPSAFSNAQVWLYRTQDGGQHWSPWTHYQSMLGNLQAISLNHIRASVTTGPLLLNNQKTKAGFSLITFHHGHWVSLPLPSGTTHRQQQDQLLQIDFADAYTGWMLLDNGRGNAQLWITHDGGRKWHELHPKIES